MLYIVNCMYLMAQYNIVECSAPPLKTPNRREPTGAAPEAHSVRSCHIGAHHLLALIAAQCIELSSSK